MLKNIVLMFFVLFGTNIYAEMNCTIDGGAYMVLPVDDKNLTKGVIVLPPMGTEGPDLDCDGIIDSQDDDIDGDGLSNSDEATHDTDPRNPDSDGDGYTDKEEVDADTDPSNPGEYPGSNHKPVANDDDNNTMLEDTTVSINVLENDKDEDNDTLRILSFTQPTNGTVTDNGTILSYTPNANFNGTDTFTYTITDEDKNDTATVTVVVTPVNDAPVAEDDNTSMLEDGATISIDVLANDEDVDNAISELIISIVEGANHGGTVAVNGTKIDYTPAANFNGIETFKYTLNDGAASSNIGTVEINVSAVADGPVAVDDHVAVEVNGTIDIMVLNNDYHPDGLELNISIVGTAPHGTLSGADNDGTITYTPNADYNGTDSFTYTITDGDRNATATVTIEVNVLPIALDDNITIDEDNVSVVIDVLANDSGPGISITSNTAPAHGSAENNGTHITYTPEADYNGTDTFQYTITDENGVTYTATVNIIVTQVNDGPDAVDDTTEVLEDANVSIDVFENDTDLEDDSLTIISITPPANGTVENNGTMLVYIPNPDFFGTDTFTYTISDGDKNDTATVTVTVTAVNDAPVAVNDSYIVAEDSAMNTLSVLDNDTDVDNTNSELTIIMITPPNHGGTVEVDGSTIKYTPALNFNGVEIFTYKINDGTTNSDVATVDINVTGVPDAPIAVDDNVSVLTNGSIKIKVLVNDTDAENDSLSIVSFTQPSNGVTTFATNPNKIKYVPNPDFSGTDTFTYTITDSTGTPTSTATVTVIVSPAPIAIDDNVTVDEDTNISIAVLENDSGEEIYIKKITVQPTNGIVEINGTEIIYTPNPDFNGTDKFKYRIKDVYGERDSAWVYITVTQVNDSPIAVDDAPITIDEDTNITIDVLSNDTDTENDSLIISAIITYPEHGELEFNTTSITYIPDADYNGTDTFTYEISDGNGGTDTADVNITIAQVNDAPLAVDDNVETNEDTNLTIYPLANDKDKEGDALEIVNVDFSEANGTVTISADKKSLLYAPDANFTGSATITYTMSDGAVTVEGNITITVHAVNDAPVAVDDDVNVNLGEEVIVQVLGNDSDVDGDTIRIQSVGNPSCGHVAITGGDATVTFTADENCAAGTATFDYTIQDSAGLTDTATVTVTIQ